MLCLSVNTKYVKENMPKTVKRKLASLRAFFHYLEYRDLLENNPFHKLQIRFREPAVLPKTIPLPVIVRDIAIIECDIN